MNDTDYAIVVGIRRYPNLGAGPLDGPDIDAKAVYDWLVDPDKGGVPKKQAFLVRSSDFEDPFPEVDVGGRISFKAEPTADDLAKCFGSIYESAKQNNTVRLGRRLYVYFSGHGFCVDNCDGGIYTASASPSLLHHFYVKSWFDWFYKHAVFEEFVLWMDACAEKIDVGQPNPTLLPADRESANLARGRQFVAYAAKHTLRAVERRTPDGNIRGVFTYTLLEGLNGGAVEDERITAESLRKYLKGGMKAYMDPEDVRNPDIAETPAFGTVEDIEFDPMPLTRFAHAIRFSPPHFGKTVQILDNAFAIIEGSTASSETWTVQLQSGYYKLIVDGTAETNFEVNGKTTDAVLIS
jgi:hypothetical protein